MYSWINVTYVRDMYVLLGGWINVPFRLQDVRTLGTWNQRLFYIKKDTKFSYSYHLVYRKKIQVEKVAQNQMS